MTEAIHIAIFVLIANTVPVASSSEISAQSLHPVSFPLTLWNGSTSPNSENSSISKVLSRVRESTSGGMFSRDLFQDSVKDKNILLIIGYAGQGIANDQIASVQKSIAKLSEDLDASYVLVCGNVLGSDISFAVQEANISASRYRVGFFLTSFLSQWKPLNLIQMEYAIVMDEESWPNMVASIADSALEAGGHVHVVVFGGGADTFKEISALFKVISIKKDWEQSSIILNLDTKPREASNHLDASATVKFLESQMHDASDSRKNAVFIINSESISQFKKPLP